MEEYILYMNRKNRKTAAKVLLLCFCAFVLLSFVVFSNTRFNGFGDVHPAVYYCRKIGEIWSWICSVLFSYPRRFINFFN